MKLWDRVVTVSSPWVAAENPSQTQIESFENSMLTEGCVVNGEVINSVLSNSVTIEEGAFVKDCVIMGNVTVKKGARVEYSIIDHDCVIEENACVGASREAGAKIAVLGAGYRVAEGETIEPGTMCEAQK